VAGGEKRYPKVTGFAGHTHRQDKLIDRKVNMSAHPDIRQEA
jgi:hypothetical protein